MSLGWDQPGMRGRAWRVLRAEVLLANQVANQGRCTMRIEGVCTGQAQCVHHTMGIQRTGHDRRYLAPACTACNQHIGDPMRVPDPPHKPVMSW